MVNENNVRKPACSRVLHVLKGVKSAIGPAWYTLAHSERRPMLSIWPVIGRSWRWLSIFTYIRMYVIILIKQLFTGNYLVSKLFSVTQPRDTCVTYRIHIQHCWPRFYLKQISSSSQPIINLLLSTALLAEYVRPPRWPSVARQGYGILSFLNSWSGLRLHV